MVSLLMDSPTNMPTNLGISFMKKIPFLLSLSVLTLVPQLCSATSDSIPRTTTSRDTSDDRVCCSSHTTLEGKVSAFFPFSHKVREIYTDVWPSYGVELSYIGSHCVGMWIGVDYAERYGRSIRERSHCCLERDRTHLRLVPTTLGLKYTQKFYSWLECYAGLGASCGWVSVHDHSRFVTRHLHKAAAGGVAKVGINFYPTARVFVDLFVDYQYLKFKFHNSEGHRFIERTTLNMSGLRGGAGVGVKF
jgi:hypothetical protein